MGYVAERAYKIKTKKETAEDREYRLSRTYNNILRSIEKVTDAKSYLQVRNTINAYAREAGKDSRDATRLIAKLNKRIERVTTELDNTIKSLNAEIENVKNERFEESPERLQELNTLAEHRTLQFLMQLGSNHDGGTGNRRKIGNYIVHADRVDALALMRIASLPPYKDCFTAKQKQIIAEKSKNPAEIVFEKNKEPLLSEKGAQLAKAYLKSMNLRNVLKKISNEGKRYYFGDTEE